jgi:peptidoglycan/LPS O-acetylase OafA/YrhL
LAERLPSTEFRLLSLIWAVGIELRFYIIAAVITYADHFLSHRKILKPGLVMFFSGLLFLALYFFALITEFSRFGVMKFMPFFALGFVYYRWLRYRSVGSIFLGLIMLFTSLQSYILYNSVSPKTALFETTLIFAIALLLFAGLVFVTKANAILEKIDKRLGDLTYSIYLVHWPIVYAVSRSNLQGFESFFAVFTCSVVVSILIVWMVENPLLKLRDSIRRTRLYL